MLNKKNKGILLRIPLFLSIIGLVIILYAGCSLIRQMFFIKSFSQDKTSIKLTQKKFLINDKLVQRPELGSKFGEMYIPSISLDYPLIHGDRDEDLKKGIGHYAGSTLPGENGNVVTCGHRDTVFRKLKDVKIGDKIVIKTYYGKFNYKVAKIRIVQPDDRTVVVRSDKEMLTIYTCYPFEFIGHAPQRYVIEADYIGSSN